MVVCPEEQIEIACGLRKEFAKKHNKPFYYNQCQEEGKAKLKDFFGNVEQDTCKVKINTTRNSPPPFYSGICLQDTAAGRGCACLNDLCNNKQILTKQEKKEVSSQDLCSVISFKNLQLQYHKPTKPYYKPRRGSGIVIEIAFWAQALTWCHVIYYATKRSQTYIHI